MKKDIICTIITGDYGHYALALHDSIYKFNKDVNFGIFISEGHLLPAVEKELKTRATIFIYNVEDFENISIAQKLKEKYNTTYHDAYRWSMKPVFMTALLNEGYESVIYLDSDIYFFNDYSFLFDTLKKCNILLSPHWRSSDPKVDLSNFKLNFLDGIYNGGFVGATKGGNAALKYWANLCLFNCEVNMNEGFYVDQRYLDLLPTRFEGVEHIKHKGCNVANWNQVDCKRTLDNNGRVLINNTYPIVFIHFTNSLLKGVLLEKDTLLHSYLEAYRDELLKYSNKDIISIFLKNGKYLKSRTEIKEEEKTSNNLKTYISKLFNMKTN